MNKIHEINAPELDTLVKASLLFQDEVERAVIMNGNGFEDTYGKYDFIAAFGVDKCQEVFSKHDLSVLAKESWLFGHISYDFKDELFDLSPRNKASFEFQNMSFFVPKLVVSIPKGKDKLLFYGSSILMKNFLSFLDSTDSFHFHEEQFFSLRSRISEEEYKSHFSRLKKEIQYGNIYEINYCQEFNDSNPKITPNILFYQLNKKFPVPFSAFYKLKKEYVLSFSPERYFCKRGSKIYSQPIKGTARRGKDELEDNEIKKHLEQDLKERTENVMIVDLVRNDLSRTASKGSVKVEELASLYTFPNVHQLISTVSSTLNESSSVWDLIETSFPMGSMTGVPKYKALQLTDELEPVKREIYSGSIGYIDLEGDADFNVVIRSLVYSGTKNYLSLMVGGAITSMAEAESEYQECLVKASSFLNENKTIDA